MRSLQSFSLFVFLFLGCSHYSFAQLRFQEGYYITTSGEKVRTQIEDKKWVTWSNSSLLTSHNGKYIRIPVEEIQEFGIEGRLKFITANVLMESSSNLLRRLDQEAVPEFQEQRVLLKVLLEGDYTLFQYVQNTQKKFFYQVNDGPITQLVRMRFLESDSPNAKVMENPLYINQLKEIAACPVPKDFNFRYELNDLKEFFLQQYTCNNAQVSFESKDGLRPHFGLKIAAGAALTTVNVHRALNEFRLSQISPTPGMDLEFVIPTIYNEFGFRLSGLYHQIKIEEEVDFPYSRDPRSVTFEYSELILGASGYFKFHVSNNSSIYAGGGYFFPINLQETRYTETVSNLDLKDDLTHAFLGFYAGYSYRRFDLEVKLFTGSRVMEGDNEFRTEMTGRTMIMLGYRIF